MNAFQTISLAVVTVAALALNTLTVKAAAVAVVDRPAIQIRANISAVSTGEALEAAWSGAEESCGNEDVRLLDETAFVVGQTAFAAVTFICEPFGNTGV
ncbi:MAG: hypothetical protein ACI9OJ_000519 [Myxococcota bacterium]|jgi:hypothetical protein